MNGREGLRSMCNTKAVLDDRLPLHFANKLFPVRPNDFAKIKGALQLVYGKGLRQRAAGLALVAKALVGNKSGPGGRGDNS
jgi:hypothetical protein